MRWFRLSRGKGGNAAVEFALALPVFILLLMAIIDFGRFFFVQHTLQFATREGMRMALVGRTLSGVTGANPAEIRANSIIKMIRDNASLAVNPATDIQIYIFPVTTSYSDPPNWKVQNAGNPGDYMRVRSLYNYTFLTPIIGNFFGAVTIRSDGTYRNELFD
jgi:Flp pilus assembly protein TadG